MAASDEPKPEPEQPPEEPVDRSQPTGSWLARNRALAMVLGCAALCGIIGLDIYLMLRSDERRSAAIPSASAVVTPLTPAPPAPPVAPSAAPEPLDGLESSDEGEPEAAKPTPPKQYKTVQQAAAESCTTASVDGLSRQIIAQARCLSPNAYVPLPARPNLVIASQVFPFLQKEAQSKLLKAIDSRPNQKMTVNSALRTLAQQYLVWRWSANKRCGVPLATPPGQSNHEIGIAVDIAEAGAWRPVLEAHNFRWLGESDRVHFDYRGGGAIRKATDVLAFQTLWNKNNPDDKIAQDGRYTPATEERLKRSPPAGFRLGASCAKPAAKTTR